MTNSIPSLHNLHPGRPHALAARAASLADRPTQSGQSHPRARPSPGDRAPGRLFTRSRHIVDDVLTPVLRSFSKARLLIIADDLPKPIVLNWLEKGVLGCIERNASLPDLLNAIRQVAGGEVSLPQALALRLLTRMTHQTSNREGELPEPLTDREREVLTLLAQGLSNKEIAQRLYLSVRTVEGHLVNIYGKLGLHSRTEAAPRRSCRAVSSPWDAG